MDRQETGHLGSSLVDVGRDAAGTLALGNPGSGSSINQAPGDILELEGAPVDQSSVAIRERLQALVDAVGWVYSCYWTLDAERRTLVWADGVYRGKTGLGALPTPEQQARRQFLEQMQIAIARDSEQDLAARFSQCDLMPLEWFYLLSSSFTFPVGMGMPGRVFSHNSYEWLSDADRVNGTHFTRADMAKAAGIKTVLCVPVENGVVELGMTEGLREDLSLANFVCSLFCQRSDTLSSASITRERPTGVTVAMASAPSSPSGPAGKQPPTLMGGGHPALPFGVPKGTGSPPQVNASLHNPGTPPPLRSQAASPSQTMVSVGGGGGSTISGNNMVGNEIGTTGHHHGARPRASRSAGASSPGAVSGSSTCGQIVRELIAVDQRVGVLLEQRRMLNRLRTSHLLRLSNQSPQMDGRQAEFEARRSSLLGPLSSVAGSFSTTTGVQAMSSEEEMRQRVADLYRLQRELEVDVKELSGQMATSPNFMASLQHMRQASMVDSQTWNLLQVAPNLPSPQQQQQQQQQQQPSASLAVPDSSHQSSPGAGFANDWAMWQQRPPPVMRLPPSLDDQQTLQADMRGPFMATPARALRPPMLSPDAGASLSLACGNNMLGATSTPHPQQQQQQMNNGYMHNNNNNNNASAGATEANSMQTQGVDLYDQMMHRALTTTTTTNSSGRGGRSTAVGAGPTNSRRPPKRPNAATTSSSVPPQAGGAVISTPEFLAEESLRVSGNWGGGAMATTSGGSQPTTASEGAMADANLALKGDATSSAPDVAWRELISGAVVNEDTEAMKAALVASVDPRSSNTKRQRTGGSSASNSAAGAAAKEGGEAGAGANGGGCEGNGRGGAGATAGGAEAEPLAQPPVKDNLSHLMAERKRREKLNEKYCILRTIVPQIGPKADKLAVLGDTIKYVQDLKLKATLVRETYLEEKLAQLDEAGRAGKLLTASRNTHPAAGDLQLSMLRAGEQQEGRVDPNPGPYIEVKKGVEEGQILLVVKCKDRPGLFLDMMLTVHRLRLHVEQARVNSEYDSVKFGFIARFGDADARITMDGIREALCFTCDRPGWQPSTPPPRLQMPLVPPHAAMLPPSGLGK